jgi:uncharacterized coiled-coil protein SlyX
MSVVINGTTGITNDGGYTGDGVVFADTTPANTLVTTTGGNVGVGTSSPVSQLHLVSAADSGMTIYKSAVGAGNVRVVSQGGGSALAFGSDQSTGITERMRIDSSGNVGIGTSSPGTKLDVRAGSVVQTIYNTDATGNDTHSATIRAYAASTSYWNKLILDGSGIVFNAYGTERARIDSSGNLLVGTTNFAAGQNSKMIQPAAIFSSRSTTGGDGHIIFYNPNGVVGQIYTSGSSTSYATSSDYRLKEDIAPMTGALARVAALKPVTYKWKSDGSDGEGFIAHELQAVAPDAVTGEKDAVDEDGSIKPQGIDTSFLVATLTAAIQEQQAIITKQAAQIQQLQEKVLEVEEGTSNMLVENTNNLHEIITALTARVAALEGTQP